MLNLKAKGLKPRYHISVSRIETGAFKLWVNCIQQLYIPHPDAARGGDGLAPQRRDEESVISRGVALQVAFERQILKPVLHLTGFRLWV
jgi:hypothetical protein